MFYSWREFYFFRFLFSGRRDSNFFGYSFIIGGDYDRLLVFGIFLYYGSRIFRMNCDFGGFGF